MLPLSNLVETTRQLIDLVILLSLWAGCLSPLGITQTNRPAGVAQPKNSTAPLKNDEAGRRSLSQSYGKLPLSFEANQGQMAPEVKFLTRASGYSLFLTEQESILVLNNSSSKKNGQSSARRRAGSILKTRFAGRSKPALTGLDQLDSKTNYLVGKDRNSWRTGIHSYSQVKYERVYPGIDVVLLRQPGPVGVRLHRLAGRRRRLNEVKL